MALPQPLPTMSLDIIPGQSHSCILLLASPRIWTAIALCMLVLQGSLSPICLHHMPEWVMVLCSLDLQMYSFTVFYSHLYSFIACYLFKVCYWTRHRIIANHRHGHCGVVVEGCRGQLHKGQCGTNPPKALEQYDAKNKRQIQMQKSKYKYKIQIAWKSYTTAPKAIKQYDAK